jgi:hypothetical protein
VLALLLLAQPVGLELPPAEKQKRIAAIEARTEASVPFADAFTLEAGDSILVRVSLPVNDASGDLTARSKDARGGAGLRVSRWVEVVAQKPGAIVLRYAIEAGAERAPGSDIVEAVLEVRDEEGVVAKRTVAHEVTVVRPTPTPEEIALDRDAVLHHRAAAAARLAEKQDILRHERRAEAARRRLVAAAGTEDPALALAAIHAIGSLSRGPSGDAKHARATDGLTTEAALELAAKSLDELKIDEAQGIVAKLRKSGRLLKRELAAALQVLGAVQLARGDEAEARRLFGQALCADPGVASLLERPAFEEAFRQAKEKSACREPIRIGEVHVYRDQGDGGLVYQITATYSDDPLELVGGGDLEIWGTGGGVFATARVPSTEKNGRKILVGTIEDNGKMETYAGQILVKVFLRDESGVVIDSFGDPDPVSLPIEEGENLPSVSIPWWVWLIVGVAVAGAGAATAVALTRPEEDQLGIGPIEVTF